MAKLAVEDIQVGNTYEATFWANPVDDSQFKLRATHLDGKRAPKVVLWRMAMNVGIEGLVGIVPFAGDVFDAAFKANQRNVRLLDQWIEHPGKTERSSRLFGLALIGGIVAFLLALGVLAFLIGSWIWAKIR